MKRCLGAAVSFLLIASLFPLQTLATSVTPVKYGKWRQDQQVAFMWKADSRPPAWIGIPVTVRPRRSDFRT